MSQAYTTIDPWHGFSGALAPLFGDVLITRRSYGAPGVESRFALDAQLNLPLDQFRRYAWVDAQAAEAWVQDRALRVLQGHVQAVAWGPYVWRLKTRVCVKTT